MAVSRTRARSAAAFLVVGGTWLAAMAAANLATPLYAVYERRFGFSHAALTLVFKAARVPEGTDETLPHQYTADPEDAPAPAPAGVGAEPAS